jgi:hypothetical protein
MNRGLDVLASRTATRWTQASGQIVIDVEVEVDAEAEGVHPEPVRLETMVLYDAQLTK